MGDESESDGRHPAIVRGSRPTAGVFLSGGAETLHVSRQDVAPGSDRFASDPQGQAEAGERLRVINTAYSTLERCLDAPSAETLRRSPKASGRRLSRAEIDAVVAAIGSEGPLDDLFRPFGRVGAFVEGALGVLFARMTSRSS